MLISRVFILSIQITPNMGIEGPGLHVTKKRTGPNVRREQEENASMCVCVCNLRKRKHHKQDPGQYEGLSFFLSFSFTRPVPLTHPRAAASFLAKGVVLRKDVIFLFFFWSRVLALQETGEPCLMGKGRRKRNMYM